MCWRSILEWSLPNTISHGSAHHLAVSQWLICLLDVTVEVYTLALKERTKPKDLLEVVSSSGEFETIPLRSHKDTLLRRIYDRVPVWLRACRLRGTSRRFRSFSFLQLPPDLAADQVIVLEKGLNLLWASVDAMSSSAWLSALGAMDLSQMCIQATWETDSPPLIWGRGPR